MAQKFNGSVEILGEVIANKVTSSGNVSAGSMTSSGEIVGGSITTSGEIVGGSITTSGNVSTNSITANSATTKSLSVTETLNIQFTDSNGAINYIGKNIGTLSISTGTHIFTNCRGTISYSGTSAKVYIVNSPNLAISGKGNSNWRNIFVNGVAEFVAINSETGNMTSTYTNYFGANVPVKGDEISFELADYHSGDTLLTYNYRLSTTYYELIVNDAGRANFQFLDGLCKVDNTAISVRIRKAILRRYLR